MTYPRYLKTGGPDEGVVLEISSSIFLVFCTSSAGFGLGHASCRAATASRKPIR